MQIPSELLIKIIQNVVIMLLSGGTFTIEKLAMTVGIDVIKNIDKDILDDITKKVEDIFSHTFNSVKEKMQGPEMTEDQIQTFIITVQKNLENVYSV